MTDKNKENFLKELSKLSNKYDIKIGGCGCCGSPFLYRGTNKMRVEYMGDDLSYNEDTKEYEIDKG